MIQSHEQVEQPLPTRAERAGRIGELITADSQSEYDLHAGYLYARTASLIIEGSVLSAAWNIMHSNLAVAASRRGNSELATASLAAIENPVAVWTTYAAVRRQGAGDMQAEAGALLGAALPAVEFADRDEDELQIRLAQLEVQLLEGETPSKTDMENLANLWRDLGKDAVGLNLKLSTIFAEAGHMKRAHGYFDNVRTKLKATDPRRYKEHHELLQLHGARTSGHLLVHRFVNAQARGIDNDIIDKRVLAWGKKEYSDELLARLRGLRPEGFFARYHPRTFVRVEKDFEYRRKDLWSLTTLLRGGALERARAVYETIVTSATLDASIHHPLGWECAQPAAALLMAAYDTGGETADAIVSNVAGGQAKLVDGAVARIEDDHVHGPERRLELGTIEQAIASGLEAIPRLPATERRLELALSLAHMATEAYGAKSLTKDGRAEEVRTAVERTWELTASISEPAARLGYLATIRELGIPVAEDPKARAQEQFNIRYRGASGVLELTEEERLLKATENAFGIQ